MESFYSIFAVVFVLALLGLTLAVLRKRGAATWRFPVASGSARRMEVLERLSMGPQHALHLVRIAGRSVLVATSPGGCQLLMDVDGVPAPATKEPAR